MKFLLDHCVPLRFAGPLIDAGHEVVLLRDCLPVDSPDPLILNKAVELQAVLVSLNGDFADITAYPPSSHGGIVALQLKNRPETITWITAALLNYALAHPRQEEWVGKLLLIEPHRIRLRS